MILVADSGSTKTDWALIDPKTKQYTIYHTIGYNPYFIDTEAIFYSLSENLVKNFDATVVKEVYFYGAGCSNPAKVDIVRKAIARTFPNASVDVGHDLLGSARALLGDQQGFAAILGTGANTCIYDGKDCVMNIDSLGYLLGDSFRDFFKNLVSKYPDYKSYSFNCVGSVGFVFSEILIEVANSYDMKVGKVIQSPLNDLVQFHLSKLDASTTN